MRRSHLLQALAQGRDGRGEWHVARFLSPYPLGRALATDQMARALQGLAAVGTPNGPELFASAVRPSIVEHELSTTNGVSIAALPLGADSSVSFAATCPPPRSATPVLELVAPAVVWIASTPTSLPTFPGLCRREIRAEPPAGTVRGTANGCNSRSEVTGRTGEMRLMVTSVGRSLYATTERLAELRPSGSVLKSISCGRIWTSPRAQRSPPAGRRSP